MRQSRQSTDNKVPLAAFLATVPLGLLWTAPAQAEWTVVPGSSAVTMYATKQGAWFNGNFEEFAATIDFDPEEPDRGSIAGTVNTSSIDTKDDQNTAYVLQYLEVESFPEARFVSTSIHATPDAFAAEGELTLLDVTRPAILNFSFESTGEAPTPDSAATFIGQMTIDRFEFGIASDLDPTQAGQHVTIQLELNLER